MLAGEAAGGGDDEAGPGAVGGMGFVAGETDRVFGSTWKVEGAFDVEGGVFEGIEMNARLEREGGERLNRGRTREDDRVVGGGEGEVVRYCAG